MLSKSVDKYLEAKGWSSHLFLNHAKSLFSDRDIVSRSKIEVGRTVIYLRSPGAQLKIYVHHNGRSKEFMTLCTFEGDEIATFHYSSPTSAIKNCILECLNE